MLPPALALVFVLTKQGGMTPRSEQSCEPGWGGHILLPKNNSVSPSARPCGHQHTPHDGTKPPSPSPEAGPSLCVKPPLLAQVFLQNLFWFFLADKNK